MSMTTKICPICGRQFATNNKRKKYCQPECAREQQRRTNLACAKRRIRRRSRPMQMQLASKVVEMVYKATTHERAIEDIVDNYRLEEYNKR